MNVGSLFYRGSEIKVHSHHQTSLDSPTLSSASRHYGKPLSYSYDPKVSPALPSNISINSPQQTHLESGDLALSTDLFKSATYLAKNTASTPSMNKYAVAVNSAKESKNSKNWTKSSSIATHSHHCDGCNKDSNKLASPSYKVAGKSFPSLSPSPNMLISFSPQPSTVNIPPFQAESFDSQSTKSSSAIELAPTVVVKSKHKNVASATSKSHYCKGCNEDPNKSVVVPSFSPSTFSFVPTKFSCPVEHAKNIKEYIINYAYSIESTAWSESILSLVEASMLKVVAHVMLTCLNKNAGYIRRRTKIHDKEFIIDENQSKSIQSLSSLPIDKMINVCSPKFSGLNTCAYFEGSMTVFVDHLTHKDVITDAIFYALQAAIADGALLSEEIVNINLFKDSERATIDQANLSSEHKKPEPNLIWALPGMVLIVIAILVAIVRKKPQFQIKSDNRDHNLFFHDEFSETQK